MKKTFLVIGMIISIIGLLFSVLLITLHAEEKQPFRKVEAQTKDTRIGLQVGHWKTEELPDELAHIRNSAHKGAEGGGKKEWEVNLDIAQKTATLLKAEGFIVDIIPATVPPRYKADVFIAIHADSNPKKEMKGFKAAAPANDQTGKGDELVRYLEKEYTKITKQKLDKEITVNMTRYYAFNWKQRVHAIDKSTPAAIVETGFMTNKDDLDLLLNHSDIVARGLANGIVAFIHEEV